MKNVILALVVGLLTTTVYAQSEKYTTKMTALVTALDTSKNTSEFSDLAAQFERIADAEKTQWLPYYYSALCQINAAMFAIGGAMGDNSATTDPAADKAEELMNKGLALTTENSETWVLKKMLYGLRMMGNPMARYMEFGTKAATALATAKKMDTANPRIYLLEAQDKYYTPEAFGGSKEDAKKLFEKAKTLYATFKPATALHPKWGSVSVTYFLSQY
jgi:hypothetical protein